MKGCFTAIITPFLNGAVDYQSLEKLIEHQIKLGIDGIVPCGTTGESPTLTHQEHEEVIKYVINKVNGRVKVIAGTGSNSTAECLLMSTQAEKAGADALLLVAPYYNKPTQQGLYHHYSEIAKAVGIEIIIYNIPGRSSVNVEVETFKKLFEHKNITTVKEASGSVDYASEILNAIPEIDLLSGNDSLNLPLLSIGSVGCISVLSNIYPDLVKKLYQLHGEGKNKEAQKLHFDLWDLCQALFKETNPIPIKKACHLKKLISSAEMRLPLVPCQDQLSEKIKNLLDKDIFH